MAAKVLWHVTMSLDGFIAGPEDEMDWMAQYAGPNPVVEEVIRSIGAATTWGGNQGCRQSSARSMEAHGAGRCSC